MLDLAALIVGEGERRLRLSIRGEAGRCEEGWESWRRRRELGRLRKALGVFERSGPARGARAEGEGRGGRRRAANLQYPQCLATIASERVEDKGD
jgi:hypothetical protein